MGEAKVHILGNPNLEYAAVLQALVKALPAPRPRSSLRQPRGVPQRTSARPIVGDERNPCQTMRGTMRLPLPTAWTDLAVLFRGHPHEHTYFPVQMRIVSIWARSRAP